MRALNNYHHYLCTLLREIDYIGYLIGNDVGPLHTLGIKVPKKHTSNVSFYVKKAEKRSAIHNSPVTLTPLPTERQRVA